ncbi:hypothetical protein C7S18_01555 [Ahniella affigens]|uniref:Uncharacterized protein n=1 Tax=Ahniella affigens TaxID=2021234 RepID=A0A2P1PM97_9GAMM|nr:hypothetical protein [Ahniella affigens]AVP95959.1 hypothetical protein C7S18_01555 [Ahniella affigens]
MSNPFQAPQSRLAEAPEIDLGPKVFYLPWQVLLVGVLAGPIALIYMLRSNEVMLGRLARSKWILLGGIALCVLAVPLVRSLNSFAGTTSVYAGLTLIAVLWSYARQMPAIRASSHPELGTLSHAWPTLIITILASIGFSAMLAVVVFSAIGIFFPGF